MTYTRKDDTSTLTMSQAEYETLLLMLAAAAGNQIGDPVCFWRWIQFANKMNAGNPKWIAYEIPEEYAKDEAIPHDFFVRRRRIFGP